MRMHNHISNKKYMPSFDEFFKEVFPLLMSIFPYTSTIECHLHDVITHLYIRVTKIIEMQERANVNNINIREIIVTCLFSELYIRSKEHRDALWVAKNSTDGTIEEWKQYIIKVLENKNVKIPCEPPENVYKYRYNEENSWTLVKKFGVSLLRFVTYSFISVAICTWVVFYNGGISGANSQISEGKLSPSIKDIDLSLLKKQAKASRDLFLGTKRIFSSKIAQQKQKPKRKENKKIKDKQSKRDNIAKPVPPTAKELADSANRRLKKRINIGQADKGKTNIKTSSIDKSYSGIVFSSELNRYWRSLENRKLGTETTKEGRILFRRNTIEYKYLPGKVLFSNRTIKILNKKQNDSKWLKDMLDSVTDDIIK